MKILTIDDIQGIRHCVPVRDATILVSYIEAGTELYSDISGKIYYSAYGALLPISVTSTLLRDKE